MTPGVVFIPCRMTEDGGRYEAGGFATQAEAERVLEIWRSEGRTERMTINVLTLFDSVDAWRRNR